LRVERNNKYPFKTLNLTLRHKRVFIVDCYLQHQIRKNAPSGARPEAGGLGQSPNYKRRGTKKANA